MAESKPASAKPKGAAQPNRIKKLLAAQIARDYGQLTNLVVVRNAGLESADTLELRSALRAKGMRMRVVRNRLTVRAFRELGVQEAAKLFAGPTAIIDSDDPVLAAKLAGEFCRKFEKKLLLVGGLLDGKVLDAKEVEALAKSKSRPEILAGLAGLLRGASAGLVAQLLSPGGRLAAAIGALVAKREEEQTEATKDTAKTE
jgi:large subunit ribosomal protein L10